MNQLRILRLNISGFLFLFFFSLHAQTETQIVDTLAIPNFYAFRVGVDIAKPIIQLAQNQDVGIEIITDFRLKKNWYIATEIGYASEPVHEDYFNFHTKGKYAKIGFNYNTYENFKGLNNEVYIGMRYGISSFNHQLIDYQILDTNNYFGTQQNIVNQDFEGLQAHWAEAVLGLKVETFKNLYLSTGIQFKKMITQKKPENFDNLYVPGFGSVYLNGNGIGFHYGISYCFPL